MTSQDAKVELFREDTDACFLHLLKISAEGRADLYFVDNNEPIVSNGQTYAPVAFTATLPEQNQDGTISPCRLAIDNVDRMIAENIKTADGEGKKIHAQVSLIMAQTPDVIERGPLNFILRNVTITEESVTGEIYDSYVQDRKIPEGCYNPNDFPGLF